MNFRIMLMVAIGMLIATSANAGDATNGKNIYNKKCKVCHSLEVGKNKVGPSLGNLFGREAGSVDGYRYSKAMKGSTVVWDEQTLDEFITKPRKFIPRNKMPFSGLKKKEQRDDLIRYLRTKSGS